MRYRPVIVEIHSAAHKICERMAYYSLWCNYS